MAGVTTARCFTFTPVLTAGKPKLHLSSSLDSKLLTHRFHCSCLCRLGSLVSSPRTNSVVVWARYGGGGGGRSQKNDNDDDDQALNVSAVRSATVRLIDENQNMVGVVPKSEAIRIAEEADLDLVVLSPDSDPPVLKIMDYTKYRYEQQKKKKDQQKRSAASRMDLKELKMGYSIDQHDYDVRLRAAKKFLKDGDKVKIVVNLKGRENDFRNKAIDLIRRFQTDVGELATEESKNFRVKNIFITMLPNKALVQKAPETPKQKDKPAATATANEVESVNSTDTLQPGFIDR
ncbi:Translation initiation factor IF3-2, chloroplastic [Linum grandiflorum]